jgi:catalase (peroxidase I)
MANLKEPPMPVTDSANVPEKEEKAATTEAKCPFSGNASKLLAGGGTQNQVWWPSQLRVELLTQHSSKSDPLDLRLNDREEVKKLDYIADFRQDIAQRRANPDHPRRRRSHLARRREAAGGRRS